MTEDGFLPFIVETRAGIEHSRNIASLRLRRIEAGSNLKLCVTETHKKALEPQSKGFFLDFMISISQT